MVRTQISVYIAGPVCIILACFTIIYYTTSNGSWLNKPFLAIDENGGLALDTELIRREGRNLADVMLVPGGKYNIRENTIYDCFSGKNASTVPKPKNIRDFTNDVSHNGKNPDEDTKRQEAFQKKFHPDHPQKMSPEHKTSGSGSTLQAAQPPLALLNSIIERLKIHLNKSVITLVDVPCGDFYWMRELVSRRGDLHYTGMDIIPTLIERHKKNFGHLKNARFLHNDIVANPLDRPYDVILSRDMLQHLQTVDALRALEHFSKSGSQLLVTTNLKSASNTDIKSAGYRHLNLMLPPVSLVPPVCEIPDKTANTFKYLAVWTLPLKQATYA